MTKKADISDEQIIEMHDMGTTQRDMASFFGVSEGTISRRAKKLKLVWKIGRTAFGPNTAKTVTPWWISEIAVQLFADDLNGTAKKEYWWQKNREALP